MSPTALADKQNAEAHESVNLTKSQLIYFSSVSENTKRFVDKLEMNALRIPVFATEPPSFPPHCTYCSSPPMGESEANTPSFRKS